MADAPPSTAPVTVRRLLIPGLLIVWVAVMFWLWIDPDAPACEYPDFTPDACAAEEEALARKWRWLGPVFLSGPILALAAVTTMAPKGSRFRPFLALLAFVWLCAAPGLLADGFAGRVECGFYGTCTEVDRTEWEIKAVIAAGASIVAPAAIAWLLYRKGHQRLAWAIAMVAGLTLASAGLLLLPILFG
jgi:hypothetical protein